MKKTFTPDQLMERRGCYSENQVRNLPLYSMKRIHIKRIFRDVPLKDALWFLFKFSELNIEEKISLCLKLAEAVLPVYEKRYPKDDRVRKCIEATHGFNNGTVSLIELRNAASAAYAAAYAAYASSAAAYAADYAAAAYAADYAAAAYADYAAYAAYAAYADSDAYAAAAYAAAAYAAAASSKSEDYTSKLEQIVTEFIDEQ